MAEHYYTNCRRMIPVTPSEKKKILELMENLSANNRLIEKEYDNILNLHYCDTDNGYCLDDSTKAFQQCKNEYQAESVRINALIEKAYKDCGIALKEIKAIMRKSYIDQEGYDTINSILNSYEAKKRTVIKGEVIL